MALAETERCHALVLPSCAGPLWQTYNVGRSYNDYITSVQVRPPGATCTVLLGGLSRGGVEGKGTPGQGQRRPRWPCCVRSTTG